MAHDYSTGGLSKKLSCVYCRSPPEPAWKCRRIECLPGDLIQGGRGWWCWEGYWQHFATSCGPGVRVRLPYEAAAAGDTCAAAVGGGTPANRKRPLGYRPQAHVSDVVSALCAWMHHARGCGLHKQAWGLLKGGGAEGCRCGRRAGAVICSREGGMRTSSSRQSFR